MFIGPFLSRGCNYVLGVNCFGGHPVVATIKNYWSICPDVWLYKGGQEMSWNIQLEVEF